MPAPIPHLLRLALPVLALSLSFAAIPAKPGAAAEPPATGAAQATIEPESLSMLQSFFQTLDYDWHRLDTGVPPFILERIPEDLNHSASVTAKKHAFFMGLLPMVLLANQEIEKDRSDLMEILERNTPGKRILPGDHRRLQEILANYGLRGNPLTDNHVRAKLLRRIDTIPPALVLAQAANESAWGTSRFARLGNNLFGEWTFTPGTGIVPSNRPAGATYEIRKFPSIYESIRSYMRNLNTHGAYSKLRDIRNSLRKADKPVTGLALSAGLLNYSQRRERYVSDIQGMIRQNRLYDINQAFLRPDENASDGTSDSLNAGLFSTRGHLSSQPLLSSANP